MSIPLASKTRTLLVTLAVTAPLAGLPPVAGAVVVRTTLPAPLTTTPNPGGGGFDGTGVWFNPLTGAAELRGFFFPDPLYEDGKFFLLQDTSSGSAQAQVYVQGFFSRGNGVIYASTNNLNPARFAPGTAIGSSTGYQSPGAGFPDMGPLFGNWQAGNRGFLGLTIRDPGGAGSNDIFYGFADVQVNADYSITLYGFAYENVRGAPITTFLTPVPEPGAAALLMLGLAGLALARKLRG